MTIESGNWFVLWVVDAPGWAEHISTSNSVYCFTNPQPFNPSSLSSTITHLDCCAHCEEGEIVLRLKDYSCLESIHIGSYSFPHILIVEVCHLPRLKQFVVEDHCFVHPSMLDLGMACRVEDCPLLESVSIGFGSFHSYSILALKGYDLSCELTVRSSSSEDVMHGRRIRDGLFLQSRVFWIARLDEMEWSDGIDLPSLQSVTIGNDCFCRVASISFVSSHLILCFTFRSPCPHWSLPSSRCFSGALW